MWTLREPPSAGGFSPAPWVLLLRPIPRVFLRDAGFQRARCHATILIDV